MVDVDKDDIIKFIGKCNKVSDRGTDRDYKRSISMRKDVMNSPTIEIEVTGNVITSRTLIVMYSSNEMFTTKNIEHINEITDKIEEKRTELKDKVTEEKKLDFLKLAND